MDQKGFSAAGSLFSDRLLGACPSTLPPGQPIRSRRPTSKQCSVCSGFLDYNRAILSFAINILDTMKHFFSLFFRALATALLLAVASTSLPAAANVKLVDAKDLKPSADEALAAHFVVYFLRQGHYRKIPLDDAMSGKILKRYLDALDPSRSFFSSADIRSFARYRNSLDDALKRGQLNAPFTIFKRFRERVKERVGFALKTLQTDLPMDSKDSLLLDRSKAPWPTDTAALDQIWRNRVINDMITLMLAEKKADSITETLKKRYQRLQRRTFQLTRDDVFQLFINSYTQSIEPHTGYLSPRSSENFRIRMSLSLEGIGAVLAAEKDYTVVRRIVKGGAADRDNELRAGDRIVGVGQGPKGSITDIIGWRLDDVVDKIRGPRSTIVRLEILPATSGLGGKSKTISITRDRIKLEEQAAQKSVLTLPGPSGTSKRFGVITLPTFYLDFAAKVRGDKNYRSTTRDVSRLIGELKQEKIDGLIIDLRSNSGGSLSEVTSLTGLFIPTGPVVQIRDAQGKVQVNNDPDPSVQYQGPLAVLVDHGSASASEIFAAAIQDYDRGIIIGETSFGKGTVQNLISLDRYAPGSHKLGQLKMTTAQFFRIDGGSTQLRGVKPDVNMPITPSHNRFGERTLDNALPWITIPSTDYQPWNNRLLEKTYPGIQQQHQARMKSDPALALISQEINRIDTLNKQKTLPLSLQKRRQQLQQDEAQSKRRKAKLKKLFALSNLKNLLTDRLLPANDKQDESTTSEISAAFILREAARTLADSLSTAGTALTAASSPSATQVIPD